MAQFREDPRIKSKEEWEAYKLKLSNNQQKIKKTSFIENIEITTILVVAGAILFISFAVYFGNGPINQGNAKPDIPKTTIIESSGSYKGSNYSIGTSDGKFAVIFDPFLPNDNISIALAAVSFVNKIYGGVDRIDPGFENIPIGLKFRGEKASYLAVPVNDKNRDGLAGLYFSKL